MKGGCGCTARVRPAEPRDLSLLWTCKRTNEEFFEALVAKSSVYFSEPARHFCSEHGTPPYKLQGTPFTELFRRIQRLSIRQTGIDKEFTKAFECLLASALTSASHVELYLADEQAHKEALKWKETIEERYGTITPGHQSSVHSNIVNVTVLTDDLQEAEHPTEWLPGQVPYIGEGLRLSATMRKWKFHLLRDVIVSKAGGLIEGGEGATRS